MSQSGKVLHLYVEVRSAPEQQQQDVEKNKGGFEEVGGEQRVSGVNSQLLSQLSAGANQTTCQTVARAPAAHRLARDYGRGSQSPARHGVSFQTASHSCRQSPTVANKRRSLPANCGGVSASHSRSSSPSLGGVASPASRASPDGRRFGGEEPAVGDGKRSVVTFSYIKKANVKTVESPLRGAASACRRAGREDRSSNPVRFNKRLSDPVWFGSPTTTSSCGSSPKLAFRSPGGHQHAGSPGARLQSHLDPIGVAATQRAVEEFGSPLLRIKLAHALEMSAESRYNKQQTRCQSWAGSPVQRQNTCAFVSSNHVTQALYGLPRSPALDQLSSQARQSTSNASTPSGVSHQSPLHWSGQQDRSNAGSPATTRHVHRVCTRSPSPQGAIFQLGNKLAEGMNQLSGSSRPSSPAHSPEVARRLADEATKVSSIFTESRRSSLHNALGEPGSDPCSDELRGSPPNAQQFQQQILQMNIPLNGQHTPATDNTDYHQPENSVSQETNSHANHTYREEEGPDQSSIISETVASGSPALPARLLRPSQPPTEVSSPMRDPRLLRSAELRTPDTPTLHRRQPPQYTGDTWSPGLSPERRGGELLGCFESGEECTELSRRLFIHQSVEEAPVSWTSRQQWGLQEGEESSTTRGSRGGRGGRALSPTAQQKRAEQRRREVLLLGPVVLDSPEEDEGCEDGGSPEGDRLEGYGGPGEQRRRRQPGLLRVEEPPEGDQNGAMMGGSSSRSSSGVTGSLGDRDCVSPESSQSSHQSNETGAVTSGIQTDSGCLVPGPSLHCQRIARAKWEFLFGTPAEEAASRGEKNTLEVSTAPPSGNSSESPTPTPPSSLPFLLANHDVRHVEVELVTPPPAVVAPPGAASPKAGIIRRTLKYSETDLDAVPLRCYRETDIDEVLLLAEQEDADSAFGSNRSVVGTSGGTGGSSPLGGLVYDDDEDGDGEERGGRRAGEEEEDEEQQEEGEEDLEDEEEEVVSWASVRMQGDSRMREEPEVYGRKRTQETFFDNHHPALKSPLLVSGPRRATEDTFSRHFESIMESHRAKGTSYNSLDSEELLLTSSCSSTTAQTVLTFDLPTLTPAIQGPVLCHSARQIVQLSFAPLAHHEIPSLDSDSMFTVTGDTSDATRAPSSERLSSGSDDTPPPRGGGGGREPRRLGSSWDSNPSFSFPREKARLATDSELDQDLSDRLGLGSSDTLTNGSNRADVAAAKRLAKRLYNLDGFRKSDVARNLSKNNEFSRTVAEEYLSFFTFSGQAVDQALRTFLRQFALMGETQERERVLSHFSRRYLHCNPRGIPSEDAVHTLTCALMLLNTDLHGHNIGKRMSCTQFIGNLEGLNDGQDFPRDQLKVVSVVQPQACTVSLFSNSLNVTYRLPTPT